MDVIKDRDRPTRGFKKFGHQSHISKWSRACRNKHIQDKLELDEARLKAKYETKE